MDPGDVVPVEFPGTEKENREWGEDQGSATSSSPLASPMGLGVMSVSGPQVCVEVQQTGSLGNRHPTSRTDKYGTLLGVLGKPEAWLCPKELNLGGGTREPQARTWKQAGEREATQGILAKPRLPLYQMGVPTVCPHRVCVSIHKYRAWLPPLQPPRSTAMSCW
jgi:hypothetical protein